MNCATVFSALRDTRLTATEKVIFGNIAGGYQTRAEIAKASGCAESSVPRAVRKLEALGYLKRQFNEGKANTYEVLPQPDTGITSDTGIRTTRTDSARGIDSDTGVSRPADTGQTGIEDAEFVDNGARHISTGARAQKLTLNTTLSELNPEPAELAEAAVVAREAAPIKLNGSAKTMPAHQLLANLIRIVDHWALQHTKGMHNTCALIPQWMADGADFDMDIVPTVAALCARKTGQPASTLRYFDAAVREAARTRITIERQPANPITPEARNDFAPSTSGNLRVGGGKIGLGSANHLRAVEAARHADERRRMELGAGK